MTPDTLRESRATLNLTQRELATKLGVARATVQGWERGAHRVPPPAARLIETWKENTK